MGRAIRKIKVKKVDKVYPCSTDLSGILLGTPHIFVLPQSGVIEGICFFLFPGDTGVKNVSVGITITDAKGTDGITHTQMVRVGVTKVPNGIPVAAGKVISFKADVEPMQGSSLSVTYNLRVKG